MLEIFLFGGIRIKDDDRAFDYRLTGRVSTVFAYLLLNRQRLHKREVLTDLFWADKQECQGRKCLRTTLWRIRQLLEPESIQPGTYITGTKAGEIGFNCNSEYWFDVEAFEEATAKVNGRSTALDSTTIAHVEEGVGLWKSDILEGFYEEWAILERERLQNRLLKSLRFLMEGCAGAGRLSEAIDYGIRIVNYDPLREDVHRALIELYKLNGDRPRAIRQYQECCAILQRELNIDPMPETKRAFQKVIAYSGNLSSDPMDIFPTTMPSNLATQLFDLLLAANQECEKMRSYLQQAKILIDSYQSNSTREV